MSFEGMFPLPDYDGAEKRLDDLADLRLYLSMFIADDSEVSRAAEYLYGIGYRRTNA